MINVCENVLDVQGSVNNVLLLQCFSNVSGCNAVGNKALVDVDSKDQYNSTKDKTEEQKVVDFFYHCYCINNLVCDLLLPNSNNVASLLLTHLYM
jgi:hypothetical protein